MNYFGYVNCEEWYLLACWICKGLEMMMYCYICMKLEFWKGNGLDMDNLSVCNAMNYYVLEIP